MKCGDVIRNPPRKGLMTWQLLQTPFRTARWASSGTRSSRWCAEMVPILKGAKAGETVAEGDLRALANGQRVR